MTRFPASADVYKGQVRAGTLSRSSGFVSFRYADDYLDDPIAPAVATSLPRSQLEYHSASAGAVPPFFAGLLPEGRRLSALRRSIKASADDELSLLVSVGADTIGDVRIVPSGVRPHTHAPSAVDVDDWSTQSFDDLFMRLTGQRLAFSRSGVAGVQVKASARMITMPVAAAHDRFILKLEPPEYPSLVENEFAMLRAAKLSGIGSANAHLVHDRDGAVGLLVERFDRLPTRNGDRDEVRLVAQEDSCQVLGLYPADKYNIDTAQVIMGLAAQTGAPVVAAHALLRQFAFAFVAANGDAHAKNFSIFCPDGEWKVTPAYDIPTSYPYGDHSMALDIGNKRDQRIGRADLVALGGVVGVKPRAVDAICDELIETSPQWRDLVREIPFDERTTHKLLKALDYRLARIAR